MRWWLGLLQTRRKSTEVSAPARLSGGDVLLTETNAPSATGRGERASVCAGQRQDGSFGMGEVFDKKEKRNAEESRGASKK